MKIMITVVGQTGGILRHDVSLQHEGELAGAIAVALEAFRLQTRESIFNCTINIDHACAVSAAPHRLGRSRAVEEAHELLVADAN